MLGENEMTPSAGMPWRPVDNSLGIARWLETSLISAVSESQRHGQRANALDLDPQKVAAAIDA